LLGNRWYDAVVTPDASGTYTITRNSTVSIAISDAPEGIVYVPTGAPLFPTASVLIAQYGLGEIASYQVDANGDPILSMRRTFISGLDGAEGAALDLLTGDFLSRASAATRSCA
jgi:hypothetical protein